MSATIVHGPITQTTSIKNMKIGQIGTFHYGTKKVIALRTFVGLVDLNNPGLTWDEEAGLHIELLPEGSRVEVIAETIK